MSVKFQDYYATLGVSREASAEEIRRAYRALARKTHPDVDKTSGAADRFKHIAEAYEVLKDPETRKRYDALGASWREGQEFTPPPDFTAGSGPRARHHQRFRASGHPPSGGFSSFFETLFGDGFGDASFDGVEFEPGGEQRRPSRGGDVEADIEITLEEALQGGKRTLHLETGDPRQAARTLDVTLPKGLSSGSTLRLAGQGRSGSLGAGDLLLHVRVAPHPRFTLSGSALRTTLALRPDQAVLGARVPLRGLDGAEVTVRVPAGSSSGRVLRLKGLGLAQRDGTRGDLLVELAISVPTVLDEAERKLWTEIAARADRAN